MNIFSKIEYDILSKVFSLRKWYENLTKTTIIKVAFFVFSISILSVILYSQTIKWEVYNQERQIENLKQNIAILNGDICQRDSLIISYENKQEIIKSFIKDMFTNNYYTTSLTGYHPTVEQCDNTPDITADGTKFVIERAGDYRYVALSRDLLRYFNRRGAKFEFGDYIMIKGTPGGVYDGLYQVRDTMNKRHTEWIDILLTPGEKSFYYRNILMYKITKEKYVSILREIYGHYSEEPLAVLEPEVKIN